MSAALMALPMVSAHALTEPKKPLATDNATPAPTDDSLAPDQDEDQGVNTGVLPLPDPLVKTPDTNVVPGEDDLADPTPTKPANIDVIRDVSKAPEPVVRMRELIVEAAASGDIERLRALMKTSTGTTQVTIGDQPADPIAALKSQSGDPEGREILAILLDIMATGFVHIDAGTPDEAYVWPYFAEKDINSLSPPEEVELLRIITAGDLSDMKEFGGYNFYRVSISPKGEWTFFVAGD